MKIKIYNSLNDEIRDIRIDVFVNEQGFVDEFDEIDGIAEHLVMYDDNDFPIATARIFRRGDTSSYYIGRLAVRKAYRGRNLGSEMIKEAERRIFNLGGKSVLLHAQCTAVSFYEKSGYKAFGEIEYEEFCPHLWMEKKLCD